MFCRTAVRVLMWSGFGCTLGAAIAAGAVCAGWAAAAGGRARAATVNGKIASVSVLLLMSKPHQSRGELSDCAGHEPGANTAVRRTPSRSHAEESIQKN